MRSTIVGILIVIVCNVVACTSSRTVSPQSLPVNGFDPFSHTMYRGSDPDFHHFVGQRGKSRTRFRVPATQATIDPAPFKFDSGRNAFVESVNDNSIQLLVLEGAR